MGMGQRVLQGLPRAMRGRSGVVPRLRPDTQPGTGTYMMVGIAAVAGALTVLLARRGQRMDGRHVKDVMIADVKTIESSATLTDAAQRMRDANVGVLPVVEGGQLRGMVTDRDLVVRGMARGVDPTTTRIADCMTDNPVAARPDWDVEQAMEVMANEQIGRLPVVDERRRVVGIVTLSSLALRSRDGEEALHTAQEVSRRSARA